MLELEIGEALLEQVDAVAAELGVSRTDFITTAVKHALRRHHRAALTAQDEAGYRAMPADDDEVEVWQAAQFWGDPWNGLEEPQAAG